MNIYNLRLGLFYPYRFKKFQQEQEKLNEATIETLENQLRSMKSSKAETERNYEEVWEILSYSQNYLQIKFV